MAEYYRRSWRPWFPDRLKLRGSRARGNFSDQTPHPLRHISAIQCHEWMLRESAALNHARQQREDGLVATIITISSAALLAIPGLFLTKGVEFPTFESDWELYIGFFGFGVALILAMLEQIFSIWAHHKQIAITHEFYSLKSTTQSDPKTVNNVNDARLASLMAFFAALALSALGLGQIRNVSNGHSAAAAAASAASAAASAAAASAASAAATSAATSAAYSRQLR